MHLLKTFDFDGRIVGCDKSFSSIRKANDNVKDNKCLMIHAVLEGLKELILKKTQN